MWVFVKFPTVDKELSSALGLRGGAKSSTAKAADDKMLCRVSD
jgi:hypothetical protein